MRSISDIFRLLKTHNFVRFCIVGTGGVVTNLVVFFVSRNYIHTTINRAAIAAFIIAVTQNYYFNHIWTFKQTVEGRPNFLGYLKYVGINLASLSINLLAVNIILQAITGFPEVIAQAVSILLGFILTYIGSSIFVFVKKGVCPTRIQRYLSVPAINETISYLKDDIIGTFKREYKFGLAISVVIFGVLFVGQVMSVIGSKSILKPVTIQAVSKDGPIPASFERFMQLARAGNYTLLRPGSDKQKEWTVENVFIKKVLIGISATDLQSLDRVWVEIGDKQFFFDKNSFLSSWAPVEQSVLRGNLSGRESVDFLLFEAPPSVRFSTSHIPIYRVFFSSIINWAGDDVLLAKPLASSLLLALLAIFLLIFARIIVIIYQHLYNAPNISDEEILQSRRSYVVFSLSLISGIFLLGLLILLIHYFYRPNIAGILSQARSQYVTYIFKSIRPKPVERMQFVLSTIVSPFLLLTLFVWWNRIAFRGKEAIVKWYKITSFINLFLLAALLYLGLAVSGFFYVRDSFLGGNLSKYFYGILIFPVLLFLFLRKSLAKRTRTVLEVMSYACIAVAFCLSIVNVFNGFVPLDLDPVIYPMVQVLAGKSLLAPVTSFYGLFPFTLAPVFHLIGFSVLKFSLIMALLMAISFVCLKESLRLIIKDKTIYLLGFLTVIFYTVLATRTVPEYYFQYWPIRFLFPCIGLYLATIYLLKENKRVYFISFLLLAVGVFWNLEVGAALFIAWLATLFFNDLGKYQGVNQLFFSTIKHLFIGLLSIGLIVGIFIAVTRYASGYLPDFSLLFRYQKLFLAGYLNIALVPPPHIWTAVILLYLIGFLVSARAFYLGKISYVNKIIFFLTILGLGLFAYYEGQSSDITLFRVAYPALFLVVIFADVLWERVKTHSSLLCGEFLVLMFILFILFSVPFSLLRNAGTYYKFVSQAVQNIQLRNSVAQQNAAFIKSHAKEEEKVFILASPEQGIYYTESGTQPVLDVPSISDIVFPKDMDILINFLKHNTTIKVFVKQPLEAYDIFDNRIKPILQDKYKEAGKSENGLSFYELK